MVIKHVKYIIARLSDRTAKLLIPTNKVIVKQVKINNYEMLVFLNETVGRQIWWNKFYEKEETEFIYNYLKRNDICFDIGANVGYFTFLMASKVAEGVVHSFEPLPACYYLLCSSKYLNNFQNIIINNTAVGNQNSEIKFFIANDSAFSSSELPDSFKPSGIITTPIVSVDNYMANNQIERVDFIKIDVEGTELQVILGATSLLSDSNKRPNLLMVEVKLDDEGKIAPLSLDVINLLKDFRYEPKIIRNNKMVEFNIEDPTSNYNLFFLKT